MIEIQDVTKRYGENAVVDNVSASIRKGGITSLIGPNGAGKSTLLGMMSRLLKMDEGVITVDGLDVNQTPGDQMARKLAILRQQNHFEARLTVEDLVTFGRFPYCKGRPTIEDKKFVDRAIEYMELGDLRYRFLHELSGGQQQRAFVSMVLAQDTEYLLLDEPLNNLDMRHSIAMMQQLRHIVNDFNKTVIIVLHDINFASWYSDDILAMRDGKVVYHAGPDVVITPQALLDLYDVEVTVETIQGKSVGVYYGAMTVATQRSTQPGND
ncbi:MAG: ATP-binding cassette domain-containing protein [Thermomicrobiales bacterium]|nr:ATP-binding cassette domain-containing protein [Thermomicrobiales bacterium]